LGQGLLEASIIGPKINLDFLKGIKIDKKIAQKRAIWYQEIGKSVKINSHVVTQDRTKKFLRQKLYS
jgi:hypothetical protein